MSLHGMFVIRIGLALFECQRTHGALTETCAESVTVPVRDQAGFPVDDLNRTLSTRRHALPAAVAQFLVYFDDLACDLCHDM